MEGRKKEGRKEINFRLTPYTRINPSWACNPHL
jgi:hypothetical protein